MIQSLVQIYSELRNLFKCNQIRPLSTRRVLGYFWEKRWRLKKICWTGRLSHSVFIQYSHSKDVALFGGTDQCLKVPVASENVKISTIEEAGMVAMFLVAMLLSQQLFQFYKWWLFGNACWYRFSLSYNQSAQVNHEFRPLTLIGHSSVHTLRLILAWFLKWPRKWYFWVSPLKWRYVHTVIIL